MAEFNKSGFDEIKNHLEPRTPVAITDHGLTYRTATYSVDPMISIAISLKRIADAMNK